LVLVLVLKIKLMLSRFAENWMGLPNPQVSREAQKNPDQPAGLAAGAKAEKAKHSFARRSDRSHAGERAGPEGPPTKKTGQGRPVFLARIF
jgi:hypothetical protein